jgi:glycosyltransferase involved in cell wall biosynthesis
MPARTRVLYVVDSLAVGGVREVVLADLRALDERRFALGLLTLSDDLDVVGADLQDHVTPLAANYRAEYGYGLIDYAADGLLLYGARRHGGDALSQIRSFAPRILHFHTNARNLGLGVLASRADGATLAFTDHLLRLRPDEYSAHARFVLRAAYRRLYRRSHVVAVGPAVATFHRESRLLHPSKQHLLLENEVDLARFRPAEHTAPADSVDVIQVARIDTVKGTDTVIRAFGRLRSDAKLRLTFVGPDAMGGSMQRLATECVPDEHEVRFLGAREDVPALLREASIGVLISRREGFPLVVLEMMATGLPVVVSDIPELEGVVTDGVDGLVVPVDDVDAVAAALQRLTDDAELRERLGREARRSAERRMTGDRIPKLEAFYETLAARG